MWTWWVRRSGGQLGVESPPAGAAVGAGASRNAHVAVDVGLGHALLVELVSLRCRVAARGALDALPAGPDVAVSGHAGTIPLWDRLAQWGNVSYVTVTQTGVYGTP